MAFFDESDLAVFFEGPHSCEAVLTIAPGNARTVRVVPAIGHALARVDTVSIDSSAPACDAIGAEVDGARIGYSTIKIEGFAPEYVIREIRPDGSGTVTLILSED